MQEYKVQFNFMGDSSKTAIIQADSEESLKQEILKGEGWFEYEEPLSNKRKAKVYVKLETLTHFSIQDYKKTTVTARPF
ncbi:hypothetical protein [Priestia aryabhattai]|uniref:hypothetical protein n=1 Tax=Priestia aryabhattai TaxID=412384 RepID=UPI00064F9B37|nr:hypothetical protein [Priestia aryabhattai]KML27783.1 hypothetical protein VL11_17620 [Priestia aryabhattai]KMO01938.1 hypothetical protein ABV89_00235 [Priestia aryabhattai]